MFPAKRPPRLLAQVCEFFSYEHFYVLYCKFWELDTDRDFMLTRQDLSRMDSLTHAVLDRVFSQAGRPFTTGRPDRMGYEDFICTWAVWLGRTLPVSCWS